MGGGRAVTVARQAQHVEHESRVAEMDRQTSEACREEQGRNETGDGQLGRARRRQRPIWISTTRSPSQAGTPTSLASRTR